MHLEYTIISGLVGLVTVVVVPLVGWLLAARIRETDTKIGRVEAKLDAIPDQFSRVHARVSDVVRDLAALDARLSAHLEDNRRPRGKDGRL